MATNTNTMKEINLPPFYVGQRVVAVKDNIDRLFKKGDCFTVTGIIKSVCKCNDWDVNVGISKVSNSLECTVCKTIWENTTKYAWFSFRRFAPIEENFQSISLEKVLEEETKLISVN